MDPRAKRRDIIIGVFVSVIILIVGIAWYMHSLTYESTDDAQIDGHLNAIASRVSGTVTAVYAENNEPVKAGQLLVELDPRDLQAQEEQSKAQYDQAIANWPWTIRMFLLHRHQIRARSIPILPAL